MQNDDSDRLTDPFRAWSQREQDLIRRWRALDPELRRAIETVIESLTTPPPSAVH